MAPERPLGPVMVDLAGLALSAEEREMLAHPLAGGVILFARNYAAPDQLRALTAAIHAVRSPPLLVAVDQEGGRVQRFSDGFTRLPPARALGLVHDRDPGLARTLAQSLGIVLAAELGAHGVDFSFAPVLDIDFGSSSVIGDRALHSEPAVVAALAAAFVAGLRHGGMGAVGKHFPGHGFVRADSHTEVPIDERDRATIAARDLAPYAALVGHGLGGIMPAHVIYPRVDSRPAGFSPVWLQDILRGELGFDGMIFSDDLSMAGAAVAGGMAERGEAALAAGCDMVLVCNAPQAVAGVLDQLKCGALDRARAASMRGPEAPPLARSADYRVADREVARARAAGQIA